MGVLGGSPMKRRCPTTGIPYSVAGFLAPFSRAALGFVEREGAQLLRRLLERSVKRDMLGVRPLTAAHRCYHFLR